MDIQPVETTLYSLSDAPPSATADRRDGQRHMTLYRVGSIMVEDRRELCLIKNISAGGMMIRLYCSIAEGTPVTIELQTSTGVPYTAQVNAIIPLVNIPQFQPGAVVPVKIHPTDPSKVALDVYR